MASGNGNGKRAGIVARWFDVDPADGPYQLHEHNGLRAEGDEPNAARAIDLRAGKILLVTGPSGAGKSTLLRALRAARTRHATTRWVDLSRVRLPDRTVVDCMTDRLPPAAFVDEERRMVAALELLSRVGLGEVWTYLRRPRELSEGQRWRLRVALCLATAAHASGSRRRLAVLVADEFCALLDRVTAMVVARALRKAVDGANKSGRAVCAVVATSHDDLAAALRPDTHAICDFGRVTVDQPHRHGHLR